MAILKILSNKYETEEAVANVIDYCYRKGIYCGFGEIYNNCESVQEMAERLIVLKKLNGVSTERNMYHLIFSLDEYEVYSYLGNSEEAKTDPNMLDYAIHDIFNSEILQDVLYVYAIHKGWHENQTGFHLHAHILISSFSKYGEILQNKNYIFNRILQEIVNSCKTYRVHLSEYPMITYG